MTDAGSPTIVGGGVKITFVPRPVPLPIAGVTAIFRDSRAIEICWLVSRPAPVELFDVVADETSDAVALVDGGAMSGGSGVRGATYPPTCPPLVPLDDVDGIRKTGSPSGERPVGNTAVEVDIDDAELDMPMPARCPPARADEIKSVLQIDIATTVQTRVDFIFRAFLQLITTGGVAPYLPARVQRQHQKTPAV